ncbi:hypothetical protein NJT12_00010 [Flavobacterium sp. AC]|uniref:Uncharacterized protein n=1 Tax=Flavobacterium azizsancarii TaxID=2961580 RepID=A0ABT4W5W2_9FLAO|nr:hypothetical protein [Flavobacterium azizsancarii]MDA6067985.1 hypothetical protein [Flavobacterium azizsancarii]
MNSTNFIQTGGWPLNSERLQELQTSFSIFNAFGNIAGNFTIVEGCETEGTTVKDGKIYINNELLDFRSAVVSVDSTVIIVEESVNRPFENGSIKAVHTIRYATFGTSEVSFPWSDFVKPLETKSLKGLLEGIFTRLVAAETKLETIEQGAQKNVQADWNVTEILSDAYIKNKISFTSPFLRKSVFNVGNVGSAGNVNDTKMTVSFPTVNTSNYMVLGALRGRSSNWNDDNDVFWTYGNEQATSFEIYLREIVANEQNLKFYYVLIPLD